MSVFLRSIGKVSRGESAALNNRDGRRRFGGKLYRHIGQIHKSATPGVSVPDATVSHTATVNDGSDLTTYTFAGASIGTAAANRTILVGIAHNAVDISTVTVGGSSASSVVTLGGANRRCSIWQVDLATGTTADIEITFASGAQDCGVDVWAAYGILSAANDTQTSTANPMSATLSIPAGGIAVGIATCFSGSATYTWANLTEDSDQVIPASGNISYTAASTASATAQSPTITCTPSGSADNRMALCSFGPG